MCSFYYLLIFNLHYSFITLLEIIYLLKYVFKIGVKKSYSTCLNNDLDPNLIHNLKKCILISKQTVISPK